MDGLPDGQNFDPGSALEFDTNSEPAPSSRSSAWFYRTITPDLVRRFGARPIDRLKWLIEDFARRQEYRDASSARAGDGWTPESVAREMALFLLYQNGPGTLSLGAETPPAMPAKILRELSMAVADGVERFLRAEGWAVTVPAKTRRTIRTETILLGPEKGTMRAVATWMSPGAAKNRDFGLVFLLAAQDLLFSEFDYVARCKGCGLVFVREDLRQTFCSTRCGNSTRMRESRNRRKLNAAQARKGRKS